VLGLEVSELVSSSQTAADLRSLRVRAGLSLGELASRLHIAKSTLSRWESGQVAQPPSRSNDFSGTRSECRLQWYGARLNVLARDLSRSSPVAGSTNQYLHLCR
jgi:transcriptional regulator with XRE-family HTH domain